MFRFPIHFCSVQLLLTQPVSYYKWASVYPEKIYRCSARCPVLHHVEGQRPARLAHQLLVQHRDL